MIPVYLFVKHPTLYVHWGMGWGVWAGVGGHGLGYVHSGMGWGMG